MSNWREKIVLITGGSKGLGLAIAEAFSAQGAKTVLVGRDSEALNQAVGRILATGGEAFSIVADITQQGQVDAMIEKTIQHYGRIDVLVNNAGKSSRGEILATTPEEFEDLIEINFLALVRCTRAAAPYLVQSKGYLVNIGSLASKVVSRYLGAYPASKFPVAAYSQQLRLELSSQGVHVMLVCPGPIVRDDAGRRYDEHAADLPESARQPGGGVKIKGLDPKKLAGSIVQACKKRRKELVIPRKARLLFAIMQLWPSLGDWIIRKMT